MTRPLPTLVNVEQLCVEIHNYPDSTGKNYLVDGFSRGFSLAYQGPRESIECCNLLCFTSNCEVGIHKINKVVSLGRIAGSFMEKPDINLRTSPLGLVPRVAALSQHI